MTALRFLCATLLLAGFGCSDDTTSAKQADSGTATDVTPGTDAATDVGPDAAADAATDAAAVTDDPTQWPVGDAGPYTCGLRIVDISYDLPAGLGKRTVPLYIWYPASKAEGENPIYSDLFVDAKTFIGAPLAPSPYPAGYPVLVHSHGHRGFSGNSAFLMCHAASHGWVALVPEHVGNTLLESADPRPLAAWLHRPLDLKQALAWADNPPQGEPLAGKMDLSKLGVSGHSYGTYTAWAMGGATHDIASLQARCSKSPPGWDDCTSDLVQAFGGDLSDKRVKTVIALAGSGGDIFTNDGQDAVKVPVLQMNGSLDNAGQAEVFAAVKTVDLTFVTVKDGCHQLYGLGNGYLGDPACAALPNEEGAAIVRPFYLAWLRYHVLGERTAMVSDIVTGKNKVSERVTYQKKGGQ